jgi:hypothetical protein
MDMRRTTLAVVLAVGLVTACSPPEWTASDEAAVILACLEGISLAMDRPIAQLPDEARPICGDITHDLELEGCDPEEAAEIAAGAALVPDMIDERMEEC